MEVRLARLEDMDGVKALLRKYHRDTISDEDRPDGFVTTAITDEQLTELTDTICDDFRANMHESHTEPGQFPYYTTY